MGVSMEDVALGALLAVGMLVRVAEELGWRGYAIDRLVTGYSALVASLVVGLAWTL